MRHTFGGYPLYDARSVHTNRTRFRRSAVPLLERVNSIYCPSGRLPSVGWILMSRGDYNQINTLATNLQLCIDNLPTLKNWSIVHARCVTRGLATDPDALYLVEICDNRGVLSNPRFEWSIEQQYNVRAPAYPGLFYTAGGPTWTWSTMLQDMWTTMNATGLLGAWPGLPVTPSGTPEGFIFPGVPAWRAFCDILDHLGMTVACNLMNAAPFTIVVPGATDATFNTLSTRYAGALEDDLEFIDSGAARVPKTITIYFRRRNEVYGTEETVRLDYPYQWSMLSLYAVTLTIPGAPVTATGRHSIWDDFTVRVDMDSVAVAADVVTAAAIATERATEYFNRIMGNRYVTRTYTGALPFYTGSQVDGVRWFMGEDAWRTEIVNGGYPPWHNVWDHWGY